MDRFVDKFRALCEEKGTSPPETPEVRAAKEALQADYQQQYDTRKYEAQQQTKQAWGSAAAHGFMMLQQVVPFVRGY
jgi:hypothetical protein